MNRSSPARFGSTTAWLAITTCLSSLLGGIDVARGEDSPPQAAYLGAAVEVGELTIDSNSRLVDARGIKVAFRYRVGRVAGDKALHLVAHVANESGHKVRALVQDKAYRDRDGFLHGKSQLLAVPRNTWRQGSLFVPFYAMYLGAGRHRLSLQMSALSDTGSCTSGRPPRAIKVIGQTSASMDLTKPPYKLVQVLVRHVTVAEEPTDFSLFRPRKRRPDLMWRIHITTDHDGVIHRSDVRDDTYDARWYHYAPEFPLSQGDRLTLSVLDEDVTSDDNLGSIKLTLDQLLEHVGRTSPLKVGSSTNALLGQVKVRE
jgi:hypothetical protein